jgi:hypothetical protein
MHPVRLSDLTRLLGATGALQFNRWDSSPAPVRVGAPGESGCSSASRRTNGTASALWFAQPPSGTQVVAGLKEGGSAIIAPVERVIDEAVSDQAGLASHAGSLATRPGAGKGPENELPPLFTFIDRLFVNVFFSLLRLRGLAFTDFVFK